MMSMLGEAALADNGLDAILRNGNNAFTAKMFSEVVKAKPRESVVISAFSVLTPLAQLALASDGDSHNELLNAIGMPDDNVTKEVFLLINENLRSVKEVELKSASKIYVAQGFKLKDEFAVVSRDVFHSEVKNIDFINSKKAADEINAWVEDKTNKKIKNLVDADSFDAYTRVVLVNAIYFKGLWRSQFKKEATKELDFHVSDTTSIKLPMMSQTKHFNHAWNYELKAQLLQMFYKENEATIVFVLPFQNEDIKSLEGKLQDPDILNKALKNLSPTEVEVTIPKFKIETSTNLKNILPKMGVTKIFSENEARLVKLLTEQSECVFVTEAIQKAFIEVNEEGAEAAAANAFTVGYITSMRQNFPERFLADRPFLFYLKADNTIIFNGVYFG